MANRNLYTYNINGREEKGIKASIRIDPDHPIYTGHFPGLPITPGVCQVQMIREILEDEVKIPLILSRAGQIKFTAVHDPGKEPEINAIISFSNKGNLLAVSAQLQGKGKIYLKFKGEFSRQI